MDNELDGQINDIINKSTKDLKLKITRVVNKHQTKLLKEHARQLKSTSFSSRKPLRGKSKDSANNESMPSKKKSTDRYHSNSESDYYSD